ncbi:MAG: glycosyltransferase family 2 protein, partial [Saprospiraceae bacterium]|nr:glycosyltransferase family 2 protein [Saprospiraceae bacterium]
EVITTNQRVRRLKHKLWHFTFVDSTHFLNKMMRYGKWSAKDHAQRTPRVTLFHLGVKPVFRFFKHFILQKGFLDGLTGFIVSIIMAWGVFLRYLYIIEERQKN